MRHFGLLMLFIVWALISIPVSSSGEQPHIDAETVIHAGDAWTVTITVPDASAGDDVPVLLFNGLQTLTETLTLGTGGVAIWNIPAGEITQSGESVLIVQADDEEIRRMLRVLPQEPAGIDLFTTANTLPAYGGGSATIMILPRDSFGNAVANTSRFQLHTLYPNGEQVLSPFTYQNGLGRLRFNTSGDPGRVRLSVEDENISATLELMQVAGDPHHIMLNISPDCVVNDGRDRIALIAVVTDSQGNPVTDGTYVNFYWDEGEGSGLTLDGRATLRIPAPIVNGLRMYHAVSADVQSNPAFLNIVEGTCADE